MGDPKVEMDLARQASSKLGIAAAVAVLADGSTRRAAKRDLGPNLDLAIDHGQTQGGSRLYSKVVVRSRKEAAIVYQRRQQEYKVDARVPSLAD